MSDRNSKDQETGPRERGVLEIGVSHDAAIGQGAAGERSSQRSESGGLASRDLAIEYYNVCLVLEAPIRHELRGLLNAASLQLEVARRMQEKQESERAARAALQARQDVDEIGLWMTRQSRWFSLQTLSATDLDFMEALDARDAVRDIAAFLQAYGRSRATSVHLVTDLDDSGDGSDDTMLPRLVEPAIRAALILFAVRVLEGVSGEIPLALTLYLARDSRCSSLTAKWHGLSDASAKPSAERLRSGRGALKRLCEQAGASFELGTTDALINWPH